MRIKGYKWAVPVLMAGAAFWLWHGSDSKPSVPAVPSSSQAGPTGNTRPDAALPDAAPPAGGGEKPALAQSTTAAPAPPPSSSPTPGNPSPVPPATAPPGNRGDLEKAQQDLGRLQFMIRDFRLALGSNPVGNNAEIMRALRGKNSKNVSLELPKGQQLNDKGQLVDPWGTPYFFHQISSQEMEIRSAGPDRVMWNTDDLRIR